MKSKFKKISFQVCYFVLDDDHPSLLELDRGQGPQADHVRLCRRRRAPVLLGKEVVLINYFLFGSFLTLKSQFVLDSEKHFR